MQSITDEDDFIEYVSTKLEDELSAVGFSRPLKLAEKETLVDLLIADSIGLHNASVYV